MGVFIGGLMRCFGRSLGTWGPLVRPAGHATWPGGQVSSLHHLWAVDTLSTASSRNALTFAWPAKVMWVAGHTLAQLSPCIVPHHFLLSYCL
jgi:hypothetical protein